MNKRTLAAFRAKKETCSKYTKQMHIPLLCRLGNEMICFQSVALRASFVAACVRLIVPTYAFSVAVPSRAEILCPSRSGYGGWSEGSVTESSFEFKVDDI